MVESMKKVLGAVPRLLKKTLSVGKFHDFEECRFWMLPPIRLENLPAKPDPCFPRNFAVFWGAQFAERRRHNELAFKVYLIIEEPTLAHKEAP